MDVRDIFKLQELADAEVRGVNPAVRVIFSQMDVRSNPIGRNAWRNPEYLIALDEWADYNDSARELLRSIPLHELTRQIEVRCNPQAVEALCRIHSRSPRHAQTVLDRIDLSGWREQILHDPRRVESLGQLAELGHLEASVILLDLSEGTGPAAKAADEFVMHAGLFDLKEKARMDRQARVVYERYLARRGKGVSEALLSDHAGSQWVN